MCFNRKLMTIFVVFLLLVTLSAEIVAQKRKIPLVSDVSGTEWVGKDFGVEGFVITYRFENNNTLAYSYNGKSFKNGTWKQNGRKLYFETNSKFSECQLNIKGDEMTGVCWNVDKKKWRTVLYKYNKPN